MFRLSKSSDALNARVSRQAVEAKLPYLLKFLANPDDDVSGNVAPFAHDYLTLLKQTTPLSDSQAEFTKVQSRTLFRIVSPVQHCNFLALVLIMFFSLHRVSNKLCKIVFAITLLSNFHQL